MGENNTPTALKGCGVKSVAIATLVAMYCREISQLQSVQGYRMKRAHKKGYLYGPKKQKKTVAMTTCCQVLSKNQSAPIHAGVWNAKTPQKAF